MVAETTWLDAAGNIAAITAAVILVLGLVGGWFHRVSHALHVTSNKMWLGVENERPYAALGVDLRNTSSIALNYVVTQFDVTFAGRAMRDMSDPDQSLVAPHEETGWNGDREYVSASDFPLSVEVVYEIEYARKGRTYWWWRRAINGGFRAEVDAPVSGNDMTVLTEQVGGPPSDTRVPWTTKSILGWSL